MEENFDSSNSTITHCVNSAGKRKRDESDCDGSSSHFHSRMPLPFKMYDKIHNELFQQLVYARLLLPPYDIYEGRWEDTDLWIKIVDVAYMQNRLYQPSVKRALRIVLKYGEIYTKDPQLGNMEDSPLKNNIFILFNPSNTLVDCPSIEFLRSQQLENLDDTSSQSKVTQPPFQLEYKTESSISSACVGYAPNNEGIQKLLALVMARRSAGLLPGLPDGAELVPYMPELGFKGGLAVQFGNDMRSLNLNSEDQMLLMPEYGPTSPMYAYLAIQDVDCRLELLQALLQRLKNNPNQSSGGSSARSSARKRKP